tara:strand:+ start:129 stop:530 length:402 start_codon:yes stop_codon:yes gene_type:complete
MENKKDNKINFLIIDGAQDKIFFFSNFNNKSYSQSFTSSKNNFEKFSILLFGFLKENNINLKKLTHIFVNQGPGNFSGIRTSISVAKGLCIVNKLKLYGFTSDNLKGMDYSNVIYLYKKKMLTKKLIKPIYMG